MEDNKVNLISPSEKVQKLFESDLALAHMIEDEYLYFNDKDTHFQKTIRAISGDKDAIENSEGISGFVGLPTSSIKKGFPMKLFDEWNKAGLLFDGNQIDYLWVGANINLNINLVHKGILVVSDNSIFPEVDKVQEKFVVKANSVRDDNITFYGNKISLPFEASKERNEAGKVASKIMWKSIEQLGNEAYFDKTEKIDCGHPLITETIINVNGVDKINGVIFYEKSKDLKYKPIHNLEGNSLLATIALKGMLKKDYGIDVPLLHYEKYKSENFTSIPQLNEISIEKDKVINSIACSAANLRDILFEYCSAALGEDLKKAHKEVIAEKIGIPNVADKSVGSIVRQ